MTITSNGNTIASGGSVAAGSVIGMTVTVKTGSALVTTGQVNFCDASAKSCTDIHLIGSAQLTSTGTAALKFRPGIGTHAYKAVFVGTPNRAPAYAGSISSTVTLDVAGTFPTSTIIAVTGSPGKYALTAAITGVGSGEAPVGSIGFADTFNGKTFQATAPLGPSVAGFSFLNLQSPSTGRQPEAVSVGDFNRDGFSDLAVLNFCGSDPNCATGGSVTILLGNSNGTFTQAANSPLSVGNYPYSIAAGDFNGDGNADLAIVDTLTSTSGVSGSVTILIGKGDGTFTHSANSLTTPGLNPHAIAIADFNQDGIPDLAVSDISNSDVTIFLGKGDGTFAQAGSPVTVGVAPEAIAIGDFNRDGVPDMAVVNFGDGSANGSVTMLLGKGNGTFSQAPGSPVTVGVQPRAIEAADLNGDGNLDLVVPNPGFPNEVSSTVSILLGNGNGTFTPAANISLAYGSYLNSISLADFNLDGVPDLAVATVSGMAIMLGNGNGTFTAQSASTLDLLPLANGDFNGDGIPDLVEIGSLNSITILLTHLTEIATATALNLTPLGVGTHLADAEYPGDGVYTPSTSGSHSLNVLKGIPTATLTTSASAVAHGTPLKFSADVKGTGVLPSGTISFFDGDLQMGAGALSNGITSYETSALASGVHSIAASYGGDGNYAAVKLAPVAVKIIPTTTTTMTVTSKGNLVTTVPSATEVTLTASVHSGSAAVTKGQVSFCDASAKLCSDIHRLGTVQLTATGTAALMLRPSIGSHSYKAEFLGTKNDTASASATSGLSVTGAFPSITSITQSGRPGSYTLTAAVSSSERTTTGPTGKISFLDTNNKGAVLAIATLGASIAGPALVNVSNPQVGNEPGGIVAGDFNRDGILDLAVGTNDVNQSVSILLGDGTGNFSKVTKSPITASGGPVLTQDFNGDGIPDLLLSSQLGGSMTVLLGNGDGTFHPYQGGSISTNYGVYPVVSGDFNGDGIPDLAAAGGYYLAILLGNGDGSFGQVPITSTSISQAELFSSMGVGDFNGDGLADLAITNGPTQQLSIFLSNGDGTFTLAPSSPSLENANSLAIGDFNGDGKLDVALSFYGANNTVGILLGKGDGTFQAALTTTSAIDTTPFLTAVGDFNGDGIADLFLGAQVNGKTVSVLLGRGDGTFSPMPTGTTQLQCCSSTAVGDFNGDGVTDIASSSFYDGTVTVFLPQLVQASASVTGISPVGPGTHQVSASFPGDSRFAPSTSAPTALTPLVRTPVISPAYATQASSQKVILTDATPGATIYFQATGFYQTAGFVPYTQPITLSGTGHEVIQAYASETGYQQSGVVSATYYLNLPSAAAPRISLASGTYPAAQTVTLTDATIGATIYYTTNGTYPTTASAIYSGPLAISVSETLTATAIASGYSMSTAASAQYIIESSPTMLIYTLAGNSLAGYSGNGGAATTASLNSPYSTAKDTAGNVYIADYINQVIRKVAAGTGIISTFAGTGVPGYSGDGKAAITAQFQNPTAVAMDATGHLYIADYGNNAIRKVTLATGVITTVAGNGTAGFAGDNGPAVSAELSAPISIACDPAGDVFIADLGNNRIRQVLAVSGVINTVAGNGQFGYSGDGGPAIFATFDYPEGIAVDGQGNLYVADTRNNVVRLVDISGRIQTVAGNGFGAGKGLGGYRGDGGLAINAELNLPEGVAVDGASNIYIADTYNQLIRKVTASNSTINTVVGNSQACSSFSGDGGPSTNFALCYPSGVSIDSGGNILIADRSSNRILKAMTLGLPPKSMTATPTFSVAAGTYGTPQTVTISDSTLGAIIHVTLNGATPTTAGAGYNGPITVSGNVTLKAIAVAPGYLQSAAAAAAYTITAAPTAVINTVAGDGIYGFSGVGGLATSAQIGYAEGIATDSSGNLYFTDSANNVVWSVSSKTGIASIVAGSGIVGAGGDGGPAVNAQLDGPQGIAVDKAGNIYIADMWNNKVRKVSATTGLISTFAGNGTVSTNGSVGDGGPAISAELYNPRGLSLDSAGNLYIADTIENRVRFVSSSTGIISTVAGNGNFGSTGDGGLATSALLAYPTSLAVDTAGNLYIASLFDARIRKVASASRLITTIAGTGLAGTSGDGGAAIHAEVIASGIALDPAGNLYVSSPFSMIREVVASSGVITRVAGNSYVGYSGDGDSATLAAIWGPAAIAVDATGSLLFADQYNYRIRKVRFSRPAATPVFSLAAGTYVGAHTVTITDATPGATVYYTTNGVTPTSYSAKYTSAITVSASETIKAIAFSGGYANSAIASATFTISSP